jgi:hypothetical protein
MADEFQARMDNPLYGCVGALDGLAIWISKPPKNKCKNPKTYWNRKEFFSFNLQAMCDARYRFTMGSCKAAGSTHDSVAFGITHLSQVLANGGLPAGFWVAGDDAYPASDSLLTPWPGKLLSEYEDGFNFWQSSARISIEQAFGIFVARWGILWRKVVVDFNLIPTLVLCLMKLHNFCMDNNCTTSRLDKRDQIRAGGRYRQDPSDLCDLDFLLHRRRRDLEKSTLRQQLTQQLKDSGVVRRGH